MASDLERLGHGKYLLLTTFRRDGTPVPTPVWVACDERELYVWTVRDSGKVKRIRRDGAVRIAGCDIRGRSSGPEVAGTARVLDEGGTERARALIRRKYRLLGWISINASLIRRGRKGTVGLAITVP
jgi:PPOX class probable F420-dependent enzyme